MTEQEIYDVIVNTLLDDYDVDIRDLPAETPVSEVRKLSDKLDSLEFLQFIFNIEGKLGVELPPDGSVPETLGDILNSFVLAFKQQTGV